MQYSSKPSKILSLFYTSRKSKKISVITRLQSRLIISFILINLISLASPIFNSNFTAKASPIQDKATTPTDWISVTDDNGHKDIGDDLLCAWASTARIFCKVNEAGGDNKNKQASFFYDPEISSQVGHTVFASDNPSEHGWIHFFKSGSGDILGSFNIINKSGTAGHEVDDSMGIVENNLEDSNDGSGYNSLPQNDHDSNFRNANYCSIDKFTESSDQDITCVLGAGAGGRTGKSITVTGASVVKSGLKEANENKNFDKACQDNGGVLGFFLCPFIDLMKEMIGWLIGGDDSIDTNGEKRKGILISLLEVQPLNTQTGLYNAWNNMRNIASGIYVIVFLIIIMGNIFSFGIDNYTAKKLLPKLIVAAILTNMSWIICSLLIDIFNILGNGIADLIFSSTQCNSAYCSTSGGLTGASIAVAGMATIAGTVGAGLFIGVGLAGGVGLALIGVILIFLIGALASTIGAIGAMFVRQLVILALVFVSPIAFSLMVLPGTNKFYKKWWENLFKILIMYPLVIGLLSLSLIFADLTAGGTRDNVAGHRQNIIAEALPFFALMMIPKCFKWGGSILSSAGGAMAGYLSNNAKKVQGSKWAKDIKERRRDGFSDVGNKEVDANTSLWEKGLRKIGNMGSGGGFRDTKGMPIKFDGWKPVIVPADERMPNTKNAQRRATMRGKKEAEYYKEYEALESGDLRKVLAGADNDMQKAAALTRLYESDKGLAEDIVAGRKPIIDGYDMFWGNRGAGSKNKRMGSSDNRISKSYFESDEKIRESSPHLANMYKDPKGKIIPATGAEDLTTIDLFSLASLPTDKLGKLDGNFWNSLFNNPGVIAGSTEDRTLVWTRQLEAAKRKDPAKFGAMDTVDYAKHLLSELSEDGALAFYANQHKNINSRTIQALWGAAGAKPSSGFATATKKIFEDNPVTGKPDWKSHDEVSKHLYRFNRQDFSNVNIPGFNSNSFSSPSQYSNTSIDTRLMAGDIGVNAFISAGGSAQTAFSIEEMMTINDDVSLQANISKNASFIDSIDTVKKRLNTPAFTAAAAIAGSKEAKLKAELDNISITTSATGTKSISFSAPTTYPTFRNSSNIIADTPAIVSGFSSLSADQKERTIKTMNYQDIDRISHMVRTGAINSSDASSKEIAKALYDRKAELIGSSKPEDIALFSKLGNHIDIVTTPSGTEFLFK